MGRRAAVLARPRPGRDDHPVLGRYSADPPVCRRRPIKTLRSHLSVNDLAKLTATGAVPAGPSPLPPAEDGQAVELERPVSRGGLVNLGPHRLLAAEILAGQLVGIRIEPATLMFFDPGTRVLLRIRPKPLTPAQVARLRGARPAGPPPRPPTSRSGCSAAPPPPA